MPASRPVAAPLTIEVAPGELLDKLTILEIKRERIRDAAKLVNVRRELETLAQAARAGIPESEPLARLRQDLKAVNQRLWEIEDAIRLCERHQDFGPHFVALARAVYRNNDERAALKRRINELLGSRLVEEKSYAEYRVKRQT